MKSSERRQSGLTMVEVLVAMAIMAVVTSQALGMLASQLHTFHAQKRVVDVQEDARLVSDMILVDIRMAGFMVPNTSGIATADGGVNGVDTLCTSEWSSMDETQLSNASGRFDRASLANPLPASTGSVDLSVADMDIDKDGDDDFVVGEGIIIADADASHCARITRIAGGTVEFTPDTPGGGFDVLTAGGRAVPAVVYEVAGTTLRRNSLVLSDQVEDLQIEFWVDTDGDSLVSGIAEFPLDTLTGEDTFAVRSVRLSVLTRTATEDAQLPGAGRQGVANHLVGAADDFRRRLVTVTAAPRNLL